MKHYVETQWKGKMQFDALVNGHTLIMDGPEKLGGQNNGPVPKPFVLTALTGCTGMDVVALLRRAGKEVTDFVVKAEGDTTDRTPIEYIRIHLVYEFKGDQRLKQDVLHAVTISQEKFCGVSKMLKKILPVSWEVIYNGERIFTNRDACVFGCRVY
jgi:putative redox protein